MEATLNNPLIGTKTVRRWALALGALNLILGIVAIALPVVAALAANFALAWIAFLVGVLQLAHSYHTRTEPGLVWRALTGLLMMAIAVLLLAFPAQGVMAIALLLGALVLTTGLFEITVGFKIRPARGWGWALFSGIVSVLLGFLIALTWPQSSFWFLGFYVGISMIFGGIWRIALAAALKPRQSIGRS